MSTVVAFGAGEEEPYAVLLADTRSSLLALHRADDPHTVVEMDVAGWMAPATDADIAALAGLDGPLLDVGCGPGRMVRAAEERGVPALGIDVSAEAAALAAAGGTPVLRRSVFDHLPLEGAWGAVLLLDGNIGIGGDPDALLARCGELVCPTGCIVVEVDSDPDLFERAEYRVVAPDGRRSATFPWARVGAAALARRSGLCGLLIVDAWGAAGRRFVTLRRA